MINHKRKLIFVHITKTAGKSIRQAFRLKGRKKPHGTAGELKCMYRSSQWHDYFKFAFVRNPWDRLVSGYHYRKSGGNKGKRDLARVDMYPESFEQFILSLDKFVNNPNDLMFRPQTYWLYDQEGNLMVDYVGRFESLSQDCKRIAEISGYSDFNLPDINKSFHSHYSQYYTPEMKKKVEELYASDIEKFGYSFEEANSPKPAMDTYHPPLIHRTPVRLPAKEISWKSRLLQIPIRILRFF